MGCNLPPVTPLRQDRTSKAAYQEIVKVAYFGIGRLDGAPTRKAWRGAKTDPPKEADLSTGVGGLNLSRRIKKTEP